MTTFDHDPVTMARRLLGQRLVRCLDGQRLAGTIVEVEAYLGAEDRAAHTWGGRRTARNESMYLAGGHAYVYFIYGMHYCLNVVCGDADEGVAVLIRAIEPTEGLDVIRGNRRGRREREWCSGPARLTRALAIDRDLDGTNLLTSDVLWIERTRERALPRARIGRSARIGVDYAGDWAEKPLRFYINGNDWTSR